MEEKNTLSISCARSAFINKPSSATLIAEYLKAKKCIRTETADEQCDKKAQKK